ncbi:thioesterase family protein [Micromonospora chokoriensis]|uniref:Thioesterase superfamily n=1 Tax=Micromonospora chokoriensis TaxID=356851 RepID=A0A1C4X514_9ACTN|nr:hotdog domain-containing protein [Micromonospora chokoriensis]SCF03559.1 Thioesterase superfamily [Micromonospora chokoriensis]
MQEQPEPAFAPGLTAQVELTVTDADTARAVGSGDVPVLGTPRVLALVEAATVAATATGMPPGSTSVGTRVELEHLAPTVVGRTVRAQALLATVDGRRLSFEVTVSDGDQTVARGRVDRIMVDRHRFVERAGRVS